MNELYQLLALRLLQMREAAGDVTTKRQLADLMHERIGGTDQTMPRVYVRIVDYMVTTRLLGSYDFLHFQVTDAGNRYVQARAADLAPALQMVIRTW